MTTVGAIYVFASAVFVNNGAVIANLSDYSGEQ